MDLEFSKEELAFREEVRSFVAEKLPADIREKVDNGHPLAKDDFVRWQKILFEKGWVAPNWPVEHGGTGWTPTQKYIFDDEMGSAGAPPVMPFGLKMVAPVIYTFGSEEQKAWLNELARISLAPHKAAEMERAFYQIDVTAEARQVTTPTLVLHPRDDATISFEEGRLMAALIPGARFVMLEGRNHIMLPDEPAWSRFLAEVRAFLGVTAESGAAESPRITFPELTPREAEALTLLARGLSNEAIAAELALTPKTVRNYASRIYDKLGVQSRAQAIVLAREAGVGGDVKRDA